MRGKTAGPRDRDQPEADALAGPPSYGRTIDKNICAITVTTAIHTAGVNLTFDIICDTSLTRTFQDHVDSSAQLGDWVVSVVANAPTNLLFVWTFRPSVAAGRKFHSTSPAIEALVLTLKTGQHDGPPP